MTRTLEVPEATIRRMMDYIGATARMTNGRHDSRIPYIVADEWSRKGYCVLSTNGLARQFGSTRRTICAAIDRLVDAGVIREVDRTKEGRAVYVPCLELGDKWRAAKEARADGQH